MKHLGLFYLGWRKVDVYAHNKDTGASFYSCYAKTGRPRIEVGTDYKDFGLVYGVLLHEAGELAMTLRGKRFRNTAQISTCHADYTFMFTHNDWIELSIEVGEFISDARKSLYKYWKKNKVK